MSWRIDVPDSPVVEPWRMLGLGARLAAVAELIPPEARVVDVGTDHAALPIGLVRRGCIGRVWAVDLSASACRAARRGSVRAGVPVDVVQADGLSGFAGGQADTAVLAGMGGSRMATLIARDRPAGRGFVRVILQPHSDWAVARTALTRASFAIVHERLVVERGRGYLVVAGERRDGPAGLTPREAYLGPRLLEARGPVFEAWIEHRRRYLEHRMAHLPPGCEADAVRAQLTWVRGERCAAGAPPGRSAAGSR